MPPPHRIPIVDIMDLCLFTAVAILDVSASDRVFCTWHPRYSSIFVAHRNNSFIPESIQSYAMYNNFRDSRQQEKGSVKATIGGKAQWSRGGLVGLVDVVYTALNGALAGMVVVMMRVASVSADTGDVGVPCFVDLNSWVFELNLNDLTASEIDGSTNNQTFPLADVGDVNGDDVTVQEFVVLRHELSVAGVVVDVV